MEPLSHLSEDVMTETGKCQQDRSNSDSLNIERCHHKPSMRTVSHYQGNEVTDVTDRNADGDVTLGNLSAPIAGVMADSDMSASNLKESDDLRATACNMKELTAGAKGFSKDTKRLPTGARGFSEDMKGLSTGAKGFSKDMKGQPIGAREFSEDMKGLPTDAKGFSEDMKGLPTGARGFSEDLKGLPTSARGFSEDMKGLPTDATRFSEDMKGLPTDTRGFSEDMKGLPTGARGFSKDMRGFESDMKGFAADMKEFTAEMKHFSADMKAFAADMKELEHGKTKNAPNVKESEVNSFTELQKNVSSKLSRVEKYPIMMSAEEPVKDISSEINNIAIAEVPECKSTIKEMRSKIDANLTQIQMDFYRNQPKFKVNAASDDKLKYMDTILKMYD